MTAGVAEVKRQLDRLLTSPTFEQATRIRRFLSYVVDETLEGRHKRLKGYTVGIEVFDRDDTFDPTTDSIVRVEAGRLRRMLDHYYLRHGQSDPIRIDLPKGSYVPTFEEHQSPAATVSEIPSKAEVIPVLPTGPSLAVLPFNNMSGDPAQEYFSDGITDEIIAKLARFSGLFVLARNTTFQYKNRAVNVRELCDQLEVHFVLEGSVRRAGDTVRVTGQLLDATTGAHIWAESFDRNLTTENVIAVQDEIAERVSARIASAYGVIPNTMRRDSPSARGIDFDAYDAVLKYYSYLGAPSGELFFEVRDQLAETVRREPTYADAWAALGFVKLDEIRDLRDVSNPAESMSAALEYTEKALSIDPGCELGWYANALVQFHLGAIDKFERALERAIALTPHNPPVLADLGIYRVLGNLPGPGLDLIEAAMKLNPSFPGWYWIGHFIDAFRLKDYKAALDYASRIDTPSWYTSYSLVAMACGKLGLNERGKQAVEETLRLKPDYPLTVRQQMEFCQLEPELIDDLVDGLRLAGMRVD